MNLKSLMSQTLLSDFFFNLVYFKIPNDFVFVMNVFC